MASAQQQQPPGDHHQQQPAACLLLLDGVPVDSAADYFTDSDDEEPPALEESTTFRWDEVILRAPVDNTAKRSLSKLRKVGGLAHTLSIAKDVFSHDASIDEIRQDFASTVEGLASTLARRYGEAAAEHLAQLLAEVREFGLCEDLDGVAFPSSHAEVGEELARCVAEVVGEELDHFRKDSTWSADETSGPQVAALLRSLREFDDVQVEQVTFVAEQTARRAHVARMQEIEQKLDGYRTVAISDQGAEVQQLWNEWQRKESDLFRRVSEAEAAAADAAQRACTVRRMHESADELGKEKQRDKDLVNKRLGIEAAIVTERNRNLRKQRDSIMGEISSLEEELAQKRKRYEILCSQRKQALEVRTHGGSRGMATRDEEGGDGTAIDLSFGTESAQARANCALELENVRTMKEQMSRSMDGGRHADASGIQQDLTDAFLTVSVGAGGSNGDENTSQKQLSYGRLVESMDDAYSATRRHLRHNQSAAGRRGGKNTTGTEAPDVKFGRRSSPSPAFQKVGASWDMDSNDNTNGAPRALVSHQQRHTKPQPMSMRSMRRHKSTPSPVRDMIRRSKSTDSGQKLFFNKPNMIISKDGKTGMERPSIKVAALNNEYAERALAELRQSIAAGAELGSRDDPEHIARLAKVTAAAASQEKITAKLRQTVVDTLAGPVGGSEHLVPPASRMTVAASHGSSQRQREQTTTLRAAMAPQGTPSGIGAGL